MTPNQEALGQAKREALEQGLIRWARDRREVDETRDPLVLAARAAGISKNRIHVLTGIARTTIDDIVKGGPDGG